MVRFGRVLSRSAETGVALCGFGQDVCVCTSYYKLQAE